MISYFIIFKLYLIIELITSYSEVWFHVADIFWTPSFMGEKNIYEKNKKRLFYTWIAMWHESRVFNRVGDLMSSTVRRYCDRNLPLSLNASRPQKKPQAEESRAGAICTTSKPLPRCGQFCSFALPDNRSRDKTTCAAFVLRPVFL